jgi:hypothetical protein
MTVLEVEAVPPNSLGRSGWETEQAARDVELLAWIGRFRFVTAQQISTQFRFSWQQANAHVRRLQRHGLVGTARRNVCEARAVFLTGKGHELLGWPRRRPPRAEVQRDHEAAIVALATELERAADDGMRVLTERECRRLHALDPAARFSVDVPGEGRDRRRWPDLVVDQAAGRRAIEIEFAPKGTARLARILAGYQTSSYSEALFLVSSPSVGRRISALAASHRGGLPSQLGLRTCEIRVDAWTPPS